MRYLTSVLTGLVMAAALGMAGTTMAAEPPSMEEADAIFESGNWEAAADAYEKIVDTQPDNGTAWFRLGYSLHAGGRLEDAIDAHRRAASFQEYRGIALYNLGCAYALMGDSDRALEALSQSSKAGFELGERAMEDSDLVSLHDDERFHEIIMRQRMSQGAGGMKQQIMMKLQQVAGMIKAEGPKVLAQLRTMAMQAWQQVQQQIAQMQKQQQRSQGGEMDERHYERHAERDDEREHDMREEHESRAEAELEHSLGSLPSLGQVRESMQSEDWESAIKATKAIVKADPENAQAWFMLGYSLHAAGHMEEAIKVHKKAAKFDNDDIRPIALYNLACAYALTGETDKAFKALEKSRKAGMELLPQIERDPDLKSLREDSRYAALLESLRGGGF